MNETEQMRAALQEIRDKAATMENGGAWAAGIATLCLGTLASTWRDWEQGDAIVCDPECIGLFYIG